MGDDLEQIVTQKTAVKAMTTTSFANVFVFIIDNESSVFEKLSISTLNILLSIKIHPAISISVTTNNAIFFIVSLPKDT